MRHLERTSTRRSLDVLSLGLFVAMAVGLPRVSEGVDLFPTGLEVTQAIQDTGAGLQLLERDDTWVRVYVQADVGLVGGVTAQLFGELGGAGGTPVGPLSPTNPGSDINVSASPSRSETNRSFQFQLPPAWRSGTVLLRAVVDSDNRFAESNEANNDFQRTISFDPPLPIKVSFIGFSHLGSAGPTFTDNLFAIGFLMRSFPGSTVDFRGARTIDAFFDLGNDVCNCPRDAAGNCTGTGTCANIAVRRCAASSDCGCGLVNEVAASVRNSDFLARSIFFETDRKYYGMVGDGGGTAFMRGCSPVPGPTGAGPTGNPAPYSWSSWDGDASYGDWYTAHELGHSYGRPHAPCCGAQGNPSNFPDANCSLSSTGDETYYGFDSLDQSALAPSSNRGADGKYTDIMSYCPREWTSDFTWDRLHGSLVAGASIIPPVPGQTAEYIVLRGLANLDLETAFIGSMHRMSSPQIPFETEPGDWSVHLHDAQQTQLLEHKFTPMPLELGQPANPNQVPQVPHETALISEIVPYVAATARVSISHLGNELDAFDVSANAPTVTLLQPNGGELVTDKATVDWSAADLDQDEITVSVLYSADDGLTWTMVATDLGSPPVDVDLSQMPGSAMARMRVLVSDGFNTATDDSDEPWELDDHDPVLAVVTPADSSFNADQDVILQAIAIDAEAGDVSDTIEWTSSVSGLLGVGASIDAGLLPPGHHQIMVRAKDDQGQTTDTFFDVFVAVTLDAPLLSPASQLGIVALMCLSGALVYLRRQRFSAPR